MRVLAVILTFALTVSAQTKPAVTDNATDHLPVKRVVLYKNGVGYFEHIGKVRGTQDINIDFTTSQLDDVLKSLTIVDLGEGRVTGVRYNSTAPLSERLRGLRLPLGEQPTREQLLNALRGSRVEVRNGTASASGKILSVETRERKNERTDEVITTTELALITDSGELRTFELTPATTVRIAEPELAKELSRYLAMIGSSRAKDVRRMTISDSGAGDRDLFVSYISEVPIWKTTYRIVIPTDAKRLPLLQGWAVVDNTIGEDWKDVKLSLVAGAPQSFIQNISQPYYARRPVVGLPETAQLAPQTHEAATEIVSGVVGGGVGSGYAGGAPPPPPPVAAPRAVYDRLDMYAKLNSANCSLSGRVTDPTGAIIANAYITATSPSGGTRSAYSDASGNFCFSGLPGGNWSVRIEQPGFNPYVARNVPIRPSGNTQISAALQLGSVSETVEVAGSEVAVVTAGRNTAMESQFESAGGREIGDLFSYDIKQPITIGKDQSALVPIVQSRVEAQKVTIFREGGDVPRNALWLRNTSGATLDSGSFSIVEGDSFAGEGLLDPIKPDERRLLSYAADSAIHVSSDDQSDLRPIARVRIMRGLMTVTRQERAKRVFTIRNTDKQARNVVIEHPARSGWKFVDGTKPEESAESLHRFLVKVEPNSTAKLEIAEYHPLETQLLLSNLTSDDVLLYSRQRVLNPQVEEQFRNILEQKNQIAGFEQQVRLREQEMNNISSDQARVRENMKALKGSAEEKALLQRYATQLNSQEDRLATLRKEIEDVRSQRDQAKQKLDATLMNISFDEEFSGK